jgi:hypothetical protein
VYVSDVTPPDLSQTLDVLAGSSLPAAARLAQRLLSALAEGRFVVRTHPFFVSTLSSWQMPADLWAELHQARLLISKGDANYRRWLGDRHWPFTAPYSELTAYRPAPLLSLRVLKSEIVVGLPPSHPSEPDWLTNGHWAMIQGTGDR